MTLNAIIANFQTFKIVDLLDITGAPCAAGSILNAASRR